LELGSGLPGGPGGGASGPGAIATNGAPGVDDRPDGRCSETDPTNQIAKTQGPIGEWSLDVPITPGLQEDIAALGASGLPFSMYVTAMLRVVSPDGATYSIKRVPVTPPVPAGRRANRNPRLIGLTFEGESWEPGRPVKIKPNSCPENRR